MNDFNKTMDALDMANEVDRQSALHRVAGRGHCAAGSHGRQKYGKADDLWRSRPSHC